MSQSSRPPGPTGTSCLTCKQRHKKCDQRRPTCERCETGGFECLGYSHIQCAPLAAHIARPMRRLLPKPVEAKGPRFHSESDGRGSCSTLPNDSLPPMASPKNAAFITISPISNGSGMNVSGKSIVSENSTSISRRIMDLYVRLPYSNPDPLKDLLDGQCFVDIFIARSSIRRLGNSKFNLWVSLVGMRIIESVLEGDTPQNRIHTNWVENVESSLKQELALDLAPREMRDRRTGWIHIALMRFRLIPSCNIYQLLRNITPVFLQVTYSIPMLWSGNRDPTRIPLLNILASEFHELAYFAIIDCMYAMASGLPQHVDYDTTFHRRCGIFASHQWVHSSPIEFQLVLADINACRDKSLTRVRKWGDIECWLLNWESRPGEYTFTESWMMVAWYAVQESWRLALLVYLYLAVCDASSDDPRIQSCVKQILQVVGTVKKRASSDVNASFFFQYLMVGICARSEIQRKLVRDKLGSEKETKLWLMRAIDFAPVLDHLWHNAAADGRPVKWGDYIRSREAVLPIVL
ncbi:unnamed protein product [Rhizoctonia solani]|uniref:Zn(2)-C6 fungal-type domain-containing protein n=1 Tax=Rhizoctonia solani TaxID=456999 RepID=A0A8H2XFN8_9AGAM|nr:unnamed protein product [Rhizoctonia solani]